MLAFEARSMPMDTPGATGTFRARNHRLWKPRREVGAQRFSRDLRLLIGARGLRGFCQGYLTVIVPLYMVNLGFDAQALGIMVACAAVGSAVMGTAVGLLSDRFGRKLFLILLTLLTAVGGAVFALSTNFWILVIAGTLGSFGRGAGAGSGGAFGPYFPAEQALVAEHVAAQQRTAAFGTLSFVGALSSAAGSLLASAPDVLAHYELAANLSTYRALFGLTVVIGILSTIVLMRISDPHRPRRTTPKKPARISPGPSVSPGPAPLGLSSPTWRIITRFMAVNTANGIMVGMLGPMLVYWFYRSYGAGASALGTLFFVINLLTGLPYLVAYRFSARFGAVRTVVVSRAISGILLAATAVAPSFLIAGLLYALRVLTNTLSLPVRQSYLMGIIEPGERASAAGLANLPNQIMSALSPYLAGFLMENFMLSLPLEIAALAQGVNVVLYHHFFSSLKPPEEQNVQATPAPILPPKAGRCTHHA